MKPQKIAILGITGAGKSTLSRRLGEKTGIPLFHMDTLFWKGKWQKVPEEEYLQGHAEILKNNSRWIIDGWIKPRMKDRLSQAHLIIYLDYPGWLVGWRYIQRWLRHRKVARPELPAESRDRFKMRWFVLSFFRNERLELETMLASVDQSKVVRLKSPEESEEYLEKHFA